MKKQKGWVCRLCYMQMILCLYYGEGSVYFWRRFFMCNLTFRHVILPLQISKLINMEFLPVSGFHLTAQNTSLLAFFVHPWVTLHGILYVLYNFGNDLTQFFLSSQTYSKMTYIRAFMEDANIGVRIWEKIYIKSNTCYMGRRKQIGCYTIFYWTCNLLNMFRARLCPSSGARDYIASMACGVWFLVAGDR